nr:hypothetical protein [Actinomadura madurae]
MIWSSVVAAPPWIVSVDAPLTAAAISSDSSDFAVPGSPTSISPRLVARVTRARSMRAVSPTNLRVTPSASSPTMNRRAAVRLSAQPGGTGPESSSRSRSSSSAKRTSAGGLWWRSVPLIAPPPRRAWSGRRGSRTP